MERKINIITLGDVGVGKSSLINRIRDGSFSEKVQSTIGCQNVFIKRPYKKKNMTILLNFLDTSGQETFQNILPKQYIRDSHIVLLVFCDLESLNNLIKRWTRFYKENCNLDDSKFILIGNKSDEFGDKRDQIRKNGNEFSQEMSALFLTCSAKSADNIDNLENFILTEAIRYIDEEDKKMEEAKKNNIVFQRTKSFNLEKKSKKKTDCSCNNKKKEVLFESD